MRIYKLIRYCLIASISFQSCKEQADLSADKHAKETRPNIVFIFADDWGWGDLSAHGHPYIKTPNIDRLVNEGTDFQKFTVASGVCSPSRTAVITGQFPARHNIDGHFAWVKNNARRNMPDWLNTEAILLPRLLQESGYATAHFGKWHLSNNMIPDSPTPDAYGYDVYGAFNCSGEQMPVHEDVQNTISFIEKSNEENKPFFINLWMHEPHTPHHVIPKYQWRFPALAEDDNIYASVLSHADDRIGELLDALDRFELTDNTLVVFSSDNGPARAAYEVKELKLMYDSATGAGFDTSASKGITGGRKGYKASLFEGGIGVPFIARWPGKIKAGAIDDTSLISAVDLLPTFCEVAKVNLPESYKPDGIGQLATLLGQEYPLRTKPLFWKYDSSWPAKKNAPNHWVSYAIVDQNWKLVANNDLSYFELYDITADTYEKKDLKVEQADRSKKLLNKIRQWQKELPESPNEKLFSKERQTF